MLLFSLFSALTGCLSSPSATITAVITDADNNPIPDVNIEILAINEYLFDSTTTASDGSFTVTLPPLQTFFTVLSHPDYIATTHTGFAGEGESVLEESLVIESLSDFQDRQSQYTDCSTEGGFIEGEVRIAIPEQETADLPIVTTARATAFDANMIATEACYISPTTDPPQTGESGRYLIPNLSPGVYEIMLHVQYDSQTDGEYYYLVYVPDNGLAPLLPTLVPL